MGMWHISRVNLEPMPEQGVQGALAGVGWQPHTLCMCLCWSGCNCTHVGWQRPVGRHQARALAAEPLGDRLVSMFDVIWL